MKTVNDVREERAPGRPQEDPRKFSGRLNFFHILTKVARSPLETFWKPLSSQCEINDGPYCVCIFFKLLYGSAAKEGLQWAIRKRLYDTLSQ